MKPIEYHTAVLSLCSDLRSTDATRMPFATLVFGGRENVGVAALAFVEVGSMSPAVNEICRDLPVVLPLMIDEAMRAALAAGGDSSPKAVMHLLEDSLRNTVFVSKVEYDLQAMCERGREGSFAEQVARRALEATLGVQLVRVDEPTVATPRGRRRASETETQSKWWPTAGVPGAEAMLA